MTETQALLERVEGCLRVGDIAGAQAALARACEGAPDRLKVLLLRGRVASAAGRCDESLRAYVEALRRAPRDLHALAGLAGSLVTIGEVDKAIACYRWALVERPADPELTVGLAWAETRAGQIDVARARLRPLIEAGKATVPALAVWGTASLQAGQVAEVVRVLEPVYERLSDRSQRATLGHVLGDVLHRAGRHADAFRVYAQANRDNIGPPYDPQAHTRYVQRLVACFTGEGGPRVRVLEPSAEDARRPRHVLIVGMPRSGTSLVEQILARHRAVFACGELSTLQRLAGTLPRRLQVEGGFPEAVAALSDEVLATLRTVYDRHLTLAPARALCMTDKMPDNYLLLGLARSFMRRLRVIYCVRDPLDTCWSAFTKNFGTSLRYTVDLHWLGCRYRDHLVWMAAYGPQLAGDLLRVPYEALVAEPERWVRAILDHCELHFDAACLHPEDNSRRVATASYAQVREPINASSIGRAGTYAPWLEELRQALGNTGPAGCQDP